MGLCVDNVGSTLGMGNGFERGNGRCWGWAATPSMRDRAGTAADGDASALTILPGP